jgi:3-methyl-2-oxobutanoate hydroxymethyltransferase
LRAWKRDGKKIAVLTAYDASAAALVEKAGIDVILVGDSLGMVIQGRETTLEVTLDDVIYHCRAVSRAVKRPLVVADMPFLSYHTGVDDAVRNAGRLVQQGGAAAVKLEGGTPAVCEVVARLVEVGIPVMGHLGLTPQSYHQFGGFRKQAKTPEDAETLLRQAHEIQAAGAFSLVLESIPAAVAAQVTAALDIPTIGIGAGPHCDGQVLVMHDILGLGEYSPPFAKVYAPVGQQMIQAFENYAAEVRSGKFPPDTES